MHARVQALLDDQVFSAYWGAVEQYGTNDLVVYLDPEEEDLRVFVREKLISNPDAPDYLKEKLAKPASEAATVMTDAATTFWFVLFLPDEMICTAVAAKRLSEGGSA